MIAVFEPFFGFQRTPFGRNLPVDQLLKYPAHEELVSRLKYTAEKRFFALITGEVGSGKSTALRHLLSLLNPNKYRTIYISDSGLTPRHFYWEALRQLDQVILDLSENQHKVPVVIVDEAHLLDREMLEEIRFLLNFRMDSYNPMGLILVGQPELRRILQLQIYEAIAQRVNVRYHLVSLDQAETKDYVVHHLKTAGISAAIFTDDALDVVYDFSGGIARKINNLCLACLLAAASENKRLVDDHLVKVVIENEFEL
jgi:type II secretory pathway predicted ATPase ExeA